MQEIYVIKGSPSLVLRLSNFLCDWWQMSVLWGLVELPVSWLPADSRSSSPEIFFISSFQLKIGFEWYNVHPINIHQQNSRLFRHQWTWVQFMGPEVTPETRWEVSINASPTVDFISNLVGVQNDTLSGISCLLCFRQVVTSDIVGLHNPCVSSSRAFHVSSGFASLYGPCVSSSRGVLGSSEGTSFHNPCASSSIGLFGSSGSIGFLSLRVSSFRGFHCNSYRPWPSYSSSWLGSSYPWFRSIWWIGKKNLPKHPKNLNFNKRLFVGMP